MNFYPRPPGGGRLQKQLDEQAKKAFLSTPSGWRATPDRAGDHGREDHFYPRPPGGGRLLRNKYVTCTTEISIHALRVEGDPMTASALASTLEFLSTPSGWRATVAVSSAFSIAPYFYPRPPGGGRQQKRTKFSSVFAQKGEEFASLRRGKRKICRWRFKKDKFWVLIWCEGSGKSVCALASHCG